MYHYFPDKDELVQAVISYQADVIAGNQRQADLGSAEGLRAWRDMVIAQARSGRGQGRLPPRLPRRPARGDRPARPDPAGRRLRAVAGRHRRRPAPPAPGRAAPGRHRPGRPRRHPPRHAPGRPSPRPGPAGHPPPGNGGRHPPPTRPKQPPGCSRRQRSPRTLDLIGLHPTVRARSQAETSHADRAERLRPNHPPSPAGPDCSHPTTVAHAGVQVGSRLFRKT